MIMKIRKTRITNKYTIFFYANNFPRFREPPLLNGSSKIDVIMIHNPIQFHKCTGISLWELKSLHNS